MTPEEYQWYINLVKDRHHALDLTFEQAEKICKYEQDRDTYSDKHYFTPWEECDYEFTVFREILGKDQIVVYEKFLAENTKRYEQGLIEEDSKKRNEILYHQELLDYYENILLPDLFKNPFIGFGWLLSDREKIEYLKSEYRRFLNDTKKEILINHFRNYRTFKPNELKLSLLRHKLICVLPDYRHFRSQMDNPTKAVCEYLVPKIKYLPDETEQLLTTKFKELKDFVEKNIEKYYDKSIGGWHVEMKPPTEDEERENRSMMLLLMDKEKYGC